MTRILSLAGISMLVFILPRMDHPDAASLGGRVTDENVTPIAAATVSVRHAFSGEFEFVHSDATGLYRFDGLRQGRYSVFGKAEGHACTWAFNILLFRGQHTNLDLTLRKSRKTSRAGDCEEEVRRTK